MGNNKIIGLQGEEYAIEYLKKHDYIILEKNFSTKFGEIDIIAQKGYIINFVEVKARKNSNFGYPYEAVNKTKQKKIIRTAQAYEKFKKLHNYQYRFDVIEVFLNTNKRINHIENAFWVE